MKSRAGFLPGAAAGALLAFVAVLLAGPAAGSGAPDLSAWVNRNLGQSSWLFAAVLLLFLLHLQRLRTLLDGTADKRAVVELDQLTDVWIHLFIGIGVIWTAVGMRAALQLTLADPEHALTDSAGTVLRKLVDGGILLALSTTIVGAMGGYLMRLGKTLYLGAELHEFYRDQQQADVRSLLAALQRIEQLLGWRQVPAGAPAPRGPHGVEQAETDRAAG